MTKPEGGRIQPQAARPRNRRFWAIGHRGFPTVAPENTISSFERAIAAGVDMIEFDVTITRDRVPVVLHDRTLDRTTNGKGSVRRKTLDEIRGLDAGSWFSGAFRGERIPTLDDILRMTKGKVALNVEIKMEAARLKPSGGVEERVLEALAVHGMERNVVVSSFFPLILKRIKRMNPKQSIALLLSQPLITDPRRIADRVHADALHVPVRELTEEAVRRSLKEEIPLRVFTVNDEAEMRRLVGWGVDGIFTDRADLIASI